mgnify:CR=1 FL=1
METIRSEKSDRIEAERKSRAMAEDRLQSVSSMVENLQNTNGLLAAEVAKLREEVEVSMAEQKN